MSEIWENEETNMSYLAVLKARRALLRRRKRSVYRSSPTALSPVVWSLAGTSRHLWKKNASQTIISYRSRADFDAGDLRLILPRWSEENFPKNLEIVDKLHQIAVKYNATASQVTLAWILAEHPTCLPFRFRVHSFSNLSCCCCRDSNSWLPHY